MAEDNNNGGVQEHGHNADVSTLDALHLDGKGLDGLDDAQEQSLPDTSEVEGEDVKGFANIQSAQRTTFEQMQQGAPPQEGAVPVGDNVTPDVYTPSEPDHNVEAQFQNPFPAFTPPEAPREQEARPAATVEAPVPEQPTPRERPVEEARPEVRPAEVAIQESPVLQVVETPPVTEPPVTQPPVTTVAQQADLLAADASGVENQPTKLDIQFATNDTDGGGDKIAYLEITGVPDYFTIVDGNGNAIGQRVGNTWRLETPTEEQVGDLWLKNTNTDSDADFSGSFTLTVNVGTLEPNGTTAVASDLLDVSIAAVADAPTLGVNDSAGMENTWISLSISVDSNDAVQETGAAANAPETQTVYISDVPAAAQLNHGSKLTSDLTLEDGTVIPSGSWVVSATDLADLKIQPPADQSHDFTLTVRAASVEGSNGDTAVSGPLTIQVDVGVVAPSAAGSGSGNEDEWQNLTLSANVNQADGTEALTVFIKDLPDDVQLAYADGTLLTKGADGRYEITGHLDDVKVRWDPATKTHTDSDIGFNLVAEVRDGDTDSDSAAVQAAAPDVNSVEVPVTVTVKAVADAPTLSASAVGVEDQWFDLSINAGLVDADGSETLTVTVAGPAGFTLSAGTETTPGTWSLTQAQLTGLRIKPAADSDSDFQLTVSATTTEAATGSQVAVKTATTTQTITVEVLSDADQPGINVVDGPQHTNEDTYYNLRTAVGGRFAVQGDLNEAGADDGQVTSVDQSETLSFQITAKQAGSRLWIDADGDGQYDAGEVTTMTQGTPVTLSASDVFAGKVHVGGPADWSSTSAINFDIRAIATDTNDDAREAALEAGGLTLDRQTTRTADDTLTLVIDPVSDSATLVDTNAGIEDQVGGITVDPVVTFTDTDLSERPTGTVSFTSTDADLAGGHFELTLDGQTTTITPAFDGTTYTWSAPSSAFTQAGNTWTLSGLKFFPKTHLAEDVTYTVSVDTQDVAGGAVRTLTATGSITVEAVADTPVIGVANAKTIESASGALDIPLSITATTPDSTDGSETVFVYISGVPTGGSLNHVAATLTSPLTVDGVTIPASAGSPVYKIAAADLADLKLTVPQEYSDDVALKVWSTTTEARNGDMAISGPSNLYVDIGINSPTATASAVTGNENSWTQLSLGGGLNLPDATETARFFIEGLPTGAEISTTASTTGKLTTTYTYVGSDGQSHTGYEVTGKLGTIYVRWADGNNDADMSLKLRALAYDQDVDLVTGTTLNNDPTKADVGGFDRATAITDTQAHDWADAVADVSVTIRAEADGPTITASKAVGVEDKYAVLKLTTALKDTDGSETLNDAVYIKLPDPTMELRSGDGSVLYSKMSVAETLADGTGTVTIDTSYYKLTRAQAADLRIANLPTDSDADFTVTVKSATTENGTDGQVLTASKVTTLNQTVTIFADADLPTVAIDDDEQVINEDAFFNLTGSLAGYDKLTGHSGEINSVADSGKSGDATETVTYQIAAKEAGSRLWIDSDGDGVQDAGEVTTMTKDQWVDVSLADLNAGKVSVGGAANWASDTASRLHFDVRTKATEADASANTSALSGTGLTRQTSQYSATDTLTLKVTGVADAATIGTSGSGLEDQTIAFKPVFTLQDADGSESIVGDVVVSVDQSGFHGEFQHLVNGQWQTMTATDDGSGHYVFTVPATDLTAVAGGTAGQSELNTVRFVPGANDATDLTYTVSVTTRDVNGAEMQTTTEPATLLIKAVADAPLVSAGSGEGLVSGLETTRNDGVGATVTGTEDTYIAVNLQAQRVDVDGSESINRAELWSVDDGWTVGYLSGGTYTAATDMGGGKWTLDPAKLDQVVLRAPADKHYLAADNVTMEFHAWTREGEADAQVATREAESSVNFKVVVNADADAPTVLVSHARTNEDVAVKLDIRPALVDTDGSESLEIYISGVPDGASFQTSAGTAVGIRGSFDADNHFQADSSGTHWQFTSAQVSNLYFVPKHDSNLDPTLTVTARSVEASNQDFAENLLQAQIKVMVTGVVDGPTAPDGTKLAEMSGNLTVSATEDTVINPNLGAYGTADVDGSESLSVVISNIPDGITVFMSDSAQTGYLKFIGGGKWSVDQDHLQYVRFQAPSNYAGTFPIKIDFVATEDDGASAKVTKTLDVTVVADADTPSGGISVSSAYRDEDSWFANGADQGIPFTVTASVGDTGGGGSAIGDGGVEQVTHVTITVDVTGFPAAKIVNGGSEWTATDGKIVIDVDVPWNAATPNTSVSLSGYKLFGVPEDWSKDIPVRLDVTATDVNGDTASHPVVTEITLNPVADAPTITFTGDSVVGGVPTYDATDGSAVLSGTFAMNDADQSEAMYMVVSGVPNGVVLSSGYNNGDGTWTVPYSAASWPLTATSHINGGTVSLEITTVVIDTDQDHDGKTDTWTAATPIRIDLDTGTGGGGTTVPADLPTGTVGGSLSTNEDNGFGLGGLTFTVQDGGTATAVVLDLSAGWSISGTYYYNPVNGTYTVPYDKLGTVTITPPADFAGAGSLVARVVVSNADGFYTLSDSDAGDGILGTVVPVDVDAVTDGGSFALSAANNTAGGIYEDAGDVALSVTLKSGDTDHSEVLVDGKVTITLSDAAKGTLSGAGVTALGGGAYEVQLSDSQIETFHTTGQVALTGLAFTPAEHFSGSLTLAFKTSAKDVDPTPDTANWEPASKLITGSLAISVKSVTDATTITANDVSGNEDTATALDVTVAHQDLSGTGAFGSETLSVVIGNVPDGALIEGATNNGDHTWTVKSANMTVTSDGVTLTGVKVIPPQDFSGDIALTVTTYALENGSTTALSETAGFTVHVAGIADTPTINPQAAIGLEDVEVAVNVNAQLVDLSETMQVTITGVPAGARFTDGAGTTVGSETVSGTWVIPQSALAGLHFVGPANASGSWTMSAVATSFDGTTHADTTATPFTVTLTGVADAPTLSVTDLTGGGDSYHASGSEDGAIALSFTAALVDADSESLAVTIAGAPAGTRFQTAGGQIVDVSSDGTWHVAATDMASLTMLPPQNWSGDTTLTLTAISSENGTTANSTATLAVHVDAVNDAPTVSLVTTGQSIPAGTVTSPIHVVPGPDAITVSDVDGTMLKGMTIAISQGAGLEDGLGLSGIDLGLDTSGHMVVNGTDISLSYDAANHTLTFTGDGSYAQYAAIASGVVLTNAAGSLEPGARQFSVTVYDENGAQGGLTTNATIGTQGDPTATQLSGDALAEVRWSADGSAVVGENTMTVSFGTAASINGNTGLDALSVEHVDGTSNWLFQVSNDGTEVAASGNGDSFVVKLDHGTAALDAQGDIVFNGDASGRIEFDAAHHLQFDNLDRLVG